MKIENEWKPTIRGEALKALYKVALQEDVDLHDSLEKAIGLAETLYGAKNRGAKIYVNYPEEYDDRELRI